MCIRDRNKEDNPTADEPNLQGFEPDDNASLLKDLQWLPRSDDFVQQDVAEWIAGQDEELQNEILNDDEIVQAVICQEDEEEEKVNDEEGNVEEKMSHAEGRAALELETTYIEQQTEATAVYFMFIEKWHDFAFNKTVEQKKAEEDNWFLLIFISKFYVL